MLEWRDDAIFNIQNNFICWLALLGLLAFLGGILRDYVLGNYVFDRYSAIILLSLLCAVWVILTMGEPTLRVFKQDSDNVIVGLVNLIVGVLPLVSVVFVFFAGAMGSDVLGQISKILSLTLLTLYFLFPPMELIQND